MSVICHELLKTRLCTVIQLASCFRKLSQVRDMHASVKFELSYVYCSNAYKFNFPTALYSST